VEYWADKRPMPADLREFGALQQDSDVSIIYCDDTYHPDSPDKATAETRT
jgi:replicative DNA helicase